MHPSQPETQTGTHNRTLFICTGWERKPPQRIPAPMGGEGFSLGQRATPTAVSSSHIILSLPETSEVLHWKLFHLYFYLHGGRLLQNTQLGQPETLPWKKPFPVPRSLPYPAGCGCNEGSNEGQRVVSVTLLSAAVKGTCSEGTWPVPRLQETEEEVASTSEWATKIT